MKTNNIQRKTKWTLSDYQKICEQRRARSDKVLLWKVCQTN